MERVNPTDESMGKAKVIKKILDKEPLTFFSGKDMADIENHFTRNMTLVFTRNMTLVQCFFFIKASTGWDSNLNLERGMKFG